MSFKPTLARIEQRLKAMDLTPTAASKRALGNGDTIRNWQRSIAKGNDPNPRIESLRAVAKVLEVTPEWLLYGDETPLQPGMAEQPVSDFIPRQDNPMQSAAVSAILARGAHLSAHTVAENYPEFLIARGDIVICDARSSDPAPGSVVVCNHVDEYGHATKIVRRYASPWLIGNGSDGLPAAIGIDTANVVMTIDAVLRIDG